MFSKKCDIIQFLANLMKPITDSERLAWIEKHLPIEHEVHPIHGHALTCWIFSSEPGNTLEYSGTFISRGSSFPDCIDQFILGNIKPLD